MSFPKYPEYKASGVEWLGEVPAHWNVVSIKWLSPVKRGASPRPIDDQKYFDNDGEFAWVRIADVSACDGVLKETNQKLSKLGSSLSVKIAPGELFVSIAGTVGKPCLSAINACIHDGFVYFPSLKLNPKFLKFLDLEIAKIDALVAEQQRLIELLKEKRQAVISHVVTKGMNSNAPMKPSGIEWLGEVPAHWSVIELKRIADVTTGMAKGKNHVGQSTVAVPYLRVANVQNGYLDLEEVELMDIPVADLARYSLKRGDVLMNEGGDFDKLGRGCVWNGKINPCITQNHVFAVRPHSVRSEWLSAITGSDYAQFYFKTRSKQSTNLASISSTNLMELPVVLPPDDEVLLILNAIAEKTVACDHLILAAGAAIDLLQERRTALISAAVTGQIDIRAVADKATA